MSNTLDKLENLQGYFSSNDKNWGTASHVGKVKLNNHLYYLCGWYEEKESVNEYNKKEIVKYFKLWITQNTEHAPSEEKLKTDTANVGFLVFNNERANNKYPHFKGEISVDGSTYYLGCWKNSKKELLNGDLIITKGFSLRVSEPNSSRDNAHEDDVIPF